MRIEERQEENEYLKLVLEEIQVGISQMDEMWHVKKKEIFAAHKYVVDNYHEMDSMEIFSNNKTIANDTDNLEQRMKRKEKLLRMQDRPYFGRIDFIFDGDEEDEAEAYYIGIGDFTSDHLRNTLVYDWRAPISNMYYDYEIGPAQYEAPMGEMSGEIIKKRQYKIKNGQLEYILDNEMRIDDEILQQELSHDADHRMKNIVATIQKEQNAIVRDEMAKVMIVQGIAGSGKTSIALHRIAYLFYKKKNELNASNVLIISPNPIFSDYISNVLPELGEENIGQVSVGQLIKEELKEMTESESKFDQIEFLLKHEADKSQRKMNIDYKGSEAFFEKLQQFIGEFVTHYVHFTELSTKEVNCARERVEELITKRYQNQPILKRLDRVIDYLAEQYELAQKEKLPSATRLQLRLQLMKMFVSTDLLEIYQAFLKQCNEEKAAPCPLIFNKDYLYYEDIFPIIYLKYALIGYEGNTHVKHLVIDEMQDYSPIEFVILKKIFNCNMTILGDIYQVLEQKETSVLEVLEKVFEEGKVIKLNHTYRSTYEIAMFAKSIIHQQGIIPFERHGEVPQVIEAKSREEMIETIVRDLKHMKAYSTVAVICKNLEETTEIYEALKPHIELTMIAADSRNFPSGIVIMPSYIAKGLEFDAVLIPNVSDQWYNTAVDQQVLYIACTRALHLLHLYHYDKRTEFIVHLPVTI